MIDKITPQIAALYLGQKCENTSGSIYTVSNTDIYSFADGTESWRKLTLHLRRLESITEEEARELYTLATGMVWTKRSSGSCLFNWIFAQRKDSMQSLYHCIGIPAVWIYLLSKGFDLFGLIDAGLAKEITNEQI
jgi:hypothetical protein